MQVVTLYDLYKYVVFKSSKNSAEAKAAGKPSRGSTTSDDDITAKNKAARKPSRGSTTSEDDTISTQEHLLSYYFRSKF